MINPSEKPVQCFLDHQVECGKGFDALPHHTMAAILFHIFSHYQAASLRVLDIECESGSLTAGLVRWAQYHSGESVSAPMQ